MIQFISLSFLKNVMLLYKKTIIDTKAGTEGLKSTLLK